MKKTILMLILVAAVVSVMVVPVGTTAAPLGDIYCQAAEEDGWANHAKNMSCLFFMQSQGYDGDEWPPATP